MVHSRNAKRRQDRIYSDAQRTHHVRVTIMQHLKEKPEMVTSYWDISSDERPKYTNGRDCIAPVGIAIIGYL